MDKNDSGLSENERVWGRSVKNKNKIKQNKTNKPTKKKNLPTNQPTNQPNKAKQKKIKKVEKYMRHT